MDHNRRAKRVRGRDDGGLARPSAGCRPICAWLLYGLIRPIPSAWWTSSARCVSARVGFFDARRDAQGGASFIPHLIDDDSGVGTQVAATDLNGDKTMDVIVGNKKGIFVHLK